MNLGKICPPGSDSIIVPMTVPTPPMELPSPRRAPSPNAAIQSARRAVVAGVSEAQAESLGASAEMSERIRGMMSDSLRRTILEQVGAARRVAGIDSMMRGATRGTPRLGRSGADSPWTSSTASSSETRRQLRPIPWNSNRSGWRWKTCSEVPSRHPNGCARAW